MSATIMLETRGLTRRFGESLAVDGLSLCVREGEIYGFLGPNGAGKTTSIRMMAGLLRPTSGEVLVRGEPVGVDAPEGRKLLGVCPQENVFYPELTARENLTYTASLYGIPRGERGPRADALLAELDLAEKAKARASSLSGGMKRRLTLALALVHDPPVVVLDEPEAGLDPQTRVAVRAFVKSLAPRKTVILTSHNMDEVERLADRVAILDHGVLVAEGTAAELKAKLTEDDALEIRLAAGEPSGVALALGGFGSASVQDRSVLLRGRELPRRLASILEHVTKAGGEVDDVRYRSASLEDVFLALTGRGLRE